MTNLEQLINLWQKLIPIEWRLSVRTMLNTMAHFLMLGGLLVVGFSAEADAPQSEIPFVVTNQLETSQCIRCVGPRFRDTGTQEVWPLASMQEIFSARVNDLSPYGGWTCRMMEFNADAGQCTSEPLDAMDFCLQEDSRMASVILNIATDGSLSTSQPQHCTTDSASVAFLGNHRRSGKPDRDSYLFMANGGTRVIALLQPEANREQGEKSAILGLRLLDRSTGAKFRKVVVGSLPLRIETTVPETGRYEVFVAQPYRWQRAPFHGFYHLSTRGNVLAPRLTVNQNAIELVDAGEPLSLLPRDAGCYHIAFSSALLDGYLKISNATRFTFRVKISQNSNILVSNATINPNSNFLYCGPEDACRTPSLPITIDLEASLNGEFVGSARFPVANIRNRVLEIIENANCP